MDPVRRLVRSVQGDACESPELAFVMTLLLQCVAVPRRMGLIPAVTCTQGVRVMRCRSCM